MRRFSKKDDNNRADTYPLSTIPLSDKESKLRRVRGSDTDNEENESTHPGTPDSTTPLKNKNNKLDPNQSDQITPELLLRLPALDHNQPKKDNAFLKFFYTLLGLSIIRYYFRFAWFLLKTASARTMTLPIGFYAPHTTEKDMQTSPILIGSTLKIFSARNPLRRGLAAFFRSEFAEVLLTIVVLFHWGVLLSCTWVAYERRNDNYKTERPRIKIMLFVIFCIYTLEAIARIIVGGFLRDGIKFPKLKHKEASFGQIRSINQRIYSTRSAYLRRSFNRLDLICIICYWTSVVLENFGWNNLFFLSALCSLRIFRLLNFASGSQVILKSLKASAPLLANVALLIGFFLLAYSILGTTFFRTSLQTRCFPLTEGFNHSTDLYFERYCGSYQKDGKTLSPEFKGEPSFFSKEKLSDGYTCPQGQICKEAENPNSGLTSFDDLAQSFVYVFIIGSGQSWSDILYQLQAATTKYCSFYFVIVLLTLNFWLLNMFVAVIAEVFANLRSNQTSAFVNANSSLNLFEKAMSLENDSLKREENLDRSGSSFFCASYSHLRKKFKLMDNKWTNYFWLALVIANMGVLGSRNSQSTPDNLKDYAWTEMIISLVFGIEILLRYFLWTEKQPFFKNLQNRIDFWLCVINTPITILNVTTSFPAYRYFTIFQLLRVYRVVWAIPNVRDLLTKVAGSIMGIANMVLFVFIMIFLCCAVAMQLFGGTIPTHENEDGGNTIFQRFFWEDWSTVLFRVMEGQQGFHTVFAAVIFIIMFFGLSNFILLNLFVAVLVENLEISESSKRKIQLEGYFEGLETNYQRVNVYLSPWNVYRYINPEPQRLKIKGIPNNLVLPVDQANVQQFLGDRLPDDNAPSYKARWSIWKLFKFPALFKSKTSNDDIELNQFTSFSGLQDIDTEALLALSSHNQDDKDTIPSFHDAHMLARDEFCEAHPTYDKSLFLFSKRSRIRRFCQILTGSEDHAKYPFKPFSLRWFMNRAFFGFMVISVVLNVICTLYETPMALKEDSYRHLFKAVDGVFLVIFSIDVGINFISEGALFSPNAYLHSAWNLTYFLALIFSFIDYLAIFTQSEGLGRLTRAGKAFRVIRLINFSDTAKFTLNAVLVSGFWKLFDAASVALCFLVPWAIYLQNVFVKRFYSCNDEVVEGIVDCIGTYTDSKMGILLPRAWSNPWKYSFDNFISSFRLLFEITSGEGWTDVMQASMKVTDIDMQPDEYESPFHAIFFVTFNFMVSVSILSLFVSIVIDNFTTKSGSALLAVEQRRWKDLSKLLKNIAPPKVRRTPPTNSIIKKLYELSIKKNGWLTYFMGAVYFAILVVLATERVDISNEELLIKSWVMFGLLLVCLVEVFIRVVGLGPIVFFSNVSNLFHFAVVTLAVISSAFLTDQYDHRNLHNFVNFFAVLVALRCMTMLDGLQQLIRTLKASLKSIINLLFVWVILFLIYATILIQVFGLTRVGVNGNTFSANFRTPTNALMMLVRFSQGEAWNSVMYDYTVQEPYCVNDDPLRFETSDCGSPAWGYTLFITFNILSMYIFLNMFVGVIVDNFSYCYQLAGQDDDDDSSITSDMLSRNQTRSFKSNWIMFDPKRTGYLKPELLVPFLLNLSHPFSCRIYDKLYSIKTLIDGSFYAYNSTGPSTSNRDTSKHDEYDIDNLNLNVLNSLLRTMDVDDCNVKRRKFNLIYHECLLFMKPGKGIPFSDVLLTMARHRLVDPNVAFEINELIKYKKIKEQVYYRISMEKVVGTLKMLVLRRRFLQHLEAKNSSGPSGLSEFNRATSFKSAKLQKDDSNKSLQPPQLPDGVFRRRGPTNLSISKREPESEDIDQDTATNYLKQLHENSWAKLLKDQSKNL